MKNPVVAAIITGVLASFMLTPLGGITIGVLVYLGAKKELKDKE